MAIINKYVNGKIYKITNNIDSICYIGSTTKELNIRMSKHISEYKVWLKNIVKYSYITSYYLFNTYKIEQCKIELIENYTCLNKIELQAREGYYIKLLESVNKVIPGRSRLESQIAYRAKNKNKKAEYYIKNIDKITYKAAEYRSKNKDNAARYNKQYRLDNIDKLKQYRLDNKEKARLKYLERNKKYY
jgi:hypothetical protein